MDCSAASLLVVQVAFYPAGRMGTDDLSRRLTLFTGADPSSDLVPTGLSRSGASIVQSCSFPRTGWDAKRYLSMGRHDVPKCLSSTLFGYSRTGRTSSNAVRIVLTPQRWQSYPTTLFASCSFLLRGALHYLLGPYRESISQGVIQCQWRLDPAGNPGGGLHLRGFSRII